MKKISIAAIIASLVAAPVAAQVERSVAPVDGESELAGAPGLTVLLGSVAAAIGIILLIDDDDDPVSP
ncbi:MAG: hypothetical protein RIB52_09565 [Erythrobacter sp.]|uniref:hypothetical protein n=1 Tax=Erythrobacter sp. TaxID=1042 RepID=UPI0032EC98C7